ELRADAHQLGRLARLGADVHEERHRLTHLDLHRIGPEGDHVVLGKHHPAGSVAEIHRTVRGPDGWACQHRHHKDARTEETHVESLYPRLRRHAGDAVTQA